MKANLLRGPARSNPARVQKYLAVADEIEADIRTGKFAVGAKIPPTRELARHYGVAYLTARQSLALLAKKGLLRGEHRSGTFVKSTPKALIGVLCKVSLADELAHFYRALVGAINKELDAQGFRGQAYDGRDGMGEAEDWPESETFRRFLNDVEQYSFAGLIALSWPRNWETPAHIAVIPRARFTEQRGQPDVSFDFEHFTFESVARLYRLGRRQIVYLRTGTQPPEFAGDLKGLDRAVAEFGIAPPKIVQCDQPASGFDAEYQGYQRTLQLVEDWRRTGRRADALLVPDDIAAHGVALALVKQGIKVPEELTVMVLANEGIRHHYGIPVVKYEVSPRQIARQLVRILRQRMDDPSTRIKPVVIRGRIVEPTES